MATWRGGYLVDVAYTEHAFEVMTPAWLSVTARFAGLEPIDLGRPHTWMELGCGHGLTASMVAAAHPDFTVWACDLIPEHIARARDVAERAGLDNVAFECRSFADVLADPLVGPAQADMIVLHGVWTWVSDEARDQIVQIVDQRLAPGGLLYVSYNVSTGWASMAPLVEGMYRAAAAHPSIHPVQAAVQLVRSLDAGGARCFPVASSEQELLSDLFDASTDVEYLAHEYLHETWTTAMFAEVAARLDEAGCSYVGSTSQLEFALAHQLTPRVARLIDRAPDRVAAETLKDLAVNRRFRRDVFRRGAASEQPVSRRLDDLLLAARGVVVADVDDPPALPESLGLPDQWWRVIRTRLAGGQVRVGELRADPAFVGLPPEGFDAAVGALLDSGLVAPLLGDPADPRAGETARRLNSVLLADRRAGRPVNYVVAPRLGLPIELPDEIMLTLAAVAAGVEPVLGVVSTDVAQQLDPGDPDELERRVALALRVVTEALPQVGVVA